MNIFLVENTCERRKFEVDKLKNDILHSQNILIEDMNQADCIIFFSCGMKYDNTIQILNQINTLSCQIIWYGCAVNMINNSCVNNFIKIPLNNYDLLLQYINTDVLDNDDEVFEILNNYRFFTFEKALKKWDPRLFIPKCKDVYPLKISEGCSNDCSYCTIRNGIGPLKSRKIDEIVCEVKCAYEKNYTTFSLQCENSGSFGKDIGLNLGILLLELKKLQLNLTIDLPDLYPSSFVDYLPEIESFLEDNSIFLIHLPLQSGSQFVLDKMHRHYSIDIVLSKLKYFVKKYPNIKVGTDIIFGFPGESDSEFKKTMGVLEKFNFQPLYIHGYCEQENTLSALINDKVDEATKCWRIKQAYQLYPNCACYLNNYRGEKNENFDGESSV